MKLVIAVFVLMIASVRCTGSTPLNAEGSSVLGVEFSARRIPMFIGRGENALYDVKINFAVSGSEKINLTGVKIQFTPESQTDCLSAISVMGKDWQNPLFGTAGKMSSTTDISGTVPMSGGNNFFTINFTPKSNAVLSQKIEILNIELSFSDKNKIIAFPKPGFANYPVNVIRAAGQDRVNTYRIPGLATTNKGTLIAVYDNRYLGSGDLQGDIDVGMSRSTDGGQTWEPMKSIMDMGTYNNLPQNQNGIGDPSVLVDQVTNTIWVAALWVNGIPGQTAWNGSKPGLKPGETGQFMLVKSEDDGITWSTPVNITEQCKKPEWNLFFQGPGKGITLKDGTLVFPAQFKDDQKIPYSTIIYSKDHGKTWSVGTGAKSNTTESQIVELKDGSLMLNMRDDRNRTEKGENNGRAISVTEDLGQTWTVHSSSNSALPESNCQASLISAKVMIKGSQTDVLFFSNPNDRNTRSHMTIKASLDQGVTWPAQYQVELNSEDSYGYSCLTMVDEKTIGILYEGTKDLYFQKIPVTDLLGSLIK
jgi:sialidase-1